jgi:tetratricopeptide (TPR) repeat protein
VYGRLAAALWVLDRRDEGQRQIARALELLRASAGEKDPEFLAAQIVAGAFAFTAGDYAAAAATFDRSVRGLTAAGGHSLELARALLGLGASHLQAQRPALAIAPLERALALSGLPATDSALLASLLGRALLDAGRDPARGRRLLREARPALAPHGPVELAHYHPGLARMVDAYYQAHPELAAPE